MMEKKSTEPECLYHKLNFVEKEQYIMCKIITAMTYRLSSFIFCTFKLNSRLDNMNKVVRNITSGEISYTFKFFMQF